MFPMQSLIDRDPEKFKTSSNEAYNVVERCEATISDDYDVPDT